MDRLDDEGALRILKLQFDVLISKTNKFSNGPKGIGSSPGMTSLDPKNQLPGSSTT
jgi:hypothetical protein